MLLYHQLWLTAFLLTQLLESPLYYRALSRAEVLGRGPEEHGLSYPRSRRLLLALTPSALTHPLLWMVWPALLRPFELPWYIHTLLGEGVVWGTEGLLLWALGVPYPWRWSAAANLLSGLSFYIFLRSTTLL